jgi:SAM-dependent methyltransferase
MAEGNRIWLDRISTSYGTQPTLSGTAVPYERGHGAEVVTSGVSAGHLYRTVVKKAGPWRRALDVGCGHGYLLSRFQAPELYGIDIAQGAIKIAKNRVKEANFCQGDSRNLPLKSNIFDCVICTELFEHLPGDDAIRECYRVLKSNGVALFTTPNKTNVWGERVPGHIRPFSFHAFASFVQEASFEIVSSRKFGLYIPFVTQFADVLSFVIGKDLPLAHPLNISVPECLATHFFIECRKPAKEEGGK